MILIDFTSDCFMPCLLCYHNDCYINIADLTLEKPGLSFYSYKSSCSFTSLLSAMHCFKATIIFFASSGFAR